MTVIPYTDSGIRDTMKKEKKIKLQAWFMVIIMVAVVFVVAASFIAGL